MATHLARVRCFIGAFALLFVVAVAVPAGAQQPGQVNPTASSVKEQQLLQELSRIQGRGTIPDVKSYVLEQPAGRDWRQFHEVTLRWLGAIAIIGVFALLIVFYMVRGMIRISSGRSGRTILRFNTLERNVHWLTAVSFGILALSGLNMTFGKVLLLPLVAPETFTLLSQWAKYAHNYLSFPFTIGVACIIFLWHKENIPNEVDVEWVKRGGGIVGRDHPPAYRFNAGQKAIYWLQTLGGTAMVITGYLLIFPFYGTDIGVMQTAQMVHGIIAMLFIAIILAHIYIGSVGMEGAFEAMGTGEVDINWAKEHHKLWVDQEMRGSPAGARPRMTPAE